MKPVLPAVLLLALALPAGAELYRWTDANGRVHFSDTPPSTGKAEALQAPTATPLNKDAAPPPGAAPAAGSSAAIAERQRRLAEAWREDAERKEREAQQAAAEKAERDAKCAELRGRLAASEGRPVFITKENGEKEYLDDATRRQYNDKVNQYLQDNCP